MSLTGLWKTESSAQECGGCGQSACDPYINDAGFAHGSYEAWYRIIGNGVELLEQPKMFIASKIDVLDGCLVCRDSNNVEHAGGLPSEGLSVEIYSLASGLQETGTDTYEITQKVCSEVCSACVGNVSQLTLQYNGLETTHVTVFQDDHLETLFKDDVSSGAEFTFTGLDKGGSMGNEIRIYVTGGQRPSTIKTSCSEPVGPGLATGRFTVISGYSTNGGLLCPLNGDECIQSEFENIWGLSSNDCTQSVWEPDQIRATAVRLRGRILDDCSSCGGLDPATCSQVDEICLVCQGDKGCEASDWNEVIYTCSPSPVACD